MTSRYVQTNGIRLHYLEDGTNGPTLVLLPGLTANAHSFDGLVAAGLADHIRVLALDLRGRGETDQPDTYTLADHAADVLGVLDALGLDRVVLGGHSFGGLLTYYLAAAHPERVSRCVVIDAPAQIHPEIFDQIKPSLDRLDVTMPSWDHYLGFVKRMPYFNEWWDPTIEGYFRADVREQPDGTVRARSRAEHIRAVIDGFKDLDWLEVGAEDRATRALLESAGRLRAARIAADRLRRAGALHGRPASERPAGRHSGKPHDDALRRRRADRGSRHRPVRARVGWPRSRGRARRRSAIVVK